MTRLYYTAPPDEAFEEVRAAALEVWGQYKGSPGGYYEEKAGRVRGMQNIKDNFMTLLAMFDTHNQRMAVRQLSEATKEELRSRMLDGGNPRNYLETIGL